MSVYVAGNYNKGATPEDLDIASENPIYIYTSPL